MLLLVSDANIFIDVEEGGLLEPFFALPYQFMTPDNLYHEELAEHHAHLLEMGVILGELDGNGIAEVELAVLKHAGPSRNDCWAMVLAKQEQCTLLTGDRQLRLAAQLERVEVVGSIWLVEQMLKHELVEHGAARIAFQKMEDAGRRLPWPAVEAMLKRYG